LLSTDFLFNEISDDIITDADLLILRLCKKIDQAKDSADDLAHSQNAKSKKMSGGEITRWNQNPCQNLGPVKMGGTRDNLRITIRCVGDENVKKMLEKLGVAAD